MRAERDAPPRLRHRLEYLLVRALVRSVELLPWAAASAIAEGVAALLHLLLRGRVRLAREQAAASLGLDARSAEVAAIARSSFRNFVRVPLLLLKLPELLRTRTPGQVLRVEGREHLDRAVARGRGVVVVTAHLGNWEVLGALMPRMDASATAVARPVANPLVDAEMRRVRERYGQRIVDKDGAGLPLARELKAGGCVALLIDQHAGSRGIRIPFFHAEASTFTFAAELARRLDATLLPVFTRSDGPRAVVGWCEPEIACDRSLPEDEDAYRMTLEFHRRLEDAVRAHPGEYLWIHRRWKAGGREPDPRWRERYARAR